jgi:archaellum component FlaG (FlaF/FlaG flagellin family)
MRRVLWIVFVVALIVSAFVAGGYAAAKSYQFTGAVKAVDAGTVTVEKSAKETLQFEVSKDTKGTPKVGDKVTVYYKMVATEIEAKAAVKKN